MQKIGPHGQRSTPEFQRWAKVARIAKAMDVGALSAAKALNPTLFTIYRFPLADEEKDTCSPEHLAAMTISALGDFKPDAVEYKNEWRCYGWDDAQRHLDELRRYVQIMHQYGHKVIGGNWSFGTPEREDVLFWQSQGWGGIDYLGAHAYSNKYVLLSDIWTILRHRLVHEWTGGHHPPIIITEVGIDNLNGAGDGWIAQGMSPEDYVSFLQGFDAEIAKDNYVLGAVVFASGTFPNMAGFETDGISDAHIVPLYSGQEPIIKPPATQPTQGAPMGYVYKGAFADFAKSHPEVGKATSDISYYPASNKEGKQMIVQWCEYGKLEYNEANGTVCFFRRAA